MDMRRSGYTTTAGIFLIVMSFFLLGMQEQSPDDIEHQRLVEQEAKLSDRIASLGHEKEFLLMQKAFYASDSKYILLDISTHTGVLKYRNRILRTFAFSTTAGKHPITRDTILQVTAKSAGKEGKRALLFGGELLIQSKRSSNVSGKEMRMPQILVGSRDFAALYYAVETGTMLHTGK